MKKPYNKYRRLSRRLSGYDYSSWGYYFLTICTHEKQPFFGEIVNGKMQLSEMGKIIKEEWEKTPDIRPNQDITLDEYVIMPNHFHAIIVFGLPFLPLASSKLFVLDTHFPEFHSPSKNLGAVIRGFKGACKRRINKLGFDQFQWQRNYHDHIIRDIESLNKIRQYIKDNPQNHGN